jgi:uncharacterized protein YaaN involved in tellurite resistance
VNKEQFEAETRTPADARAVKTLAAKAKSIDLQIESRRAELRESLLRRKRAALEEDIKVLNARAAALEKLVHVAEEAVEKGVKEAEQSGRPSTSIEVQMRKAEVDSLERFVRKLAEDIQNLRLDLRSTPRVTELIRAEPPQSKD